MLDMVRSLVGVMRNRTGHSDNDMQKLDGLSLNSVDAQG